MDKGMFAGSEAAAFAQRAMTRGVPGAVLLLEEMATNIGENLRFSAAMLPEASSMMFVAKPQTQRRMTATAGRQCPELTFFVTAPCHDMQQQPFGIHGMSGLIDEMVGDLRVWPHMRRPASNFRKSFLTSCRRHSPFSCPKALLRICHDRCWLFGGVSAKSRPCFI